MRKRHVNVLCTMIGGGGRRRRIFGILHELGAIHHEVGPRSYESDPTASVPTSLGEPRPSSPDGEACGRRDSFRDGVIRAITGCNRQRIWISCQICGKRNLQLNRLEQPGGLCILGQSPPSHHPTTSLHSLAP
jgi:hypothetical protein